MRGDKGFCVRKSLALSPRHSSVDSAADNFTEGQDPSALPLPFPSYRLLLAPPRSSRPLPSRPLPSPPLRLLPSTLLPFSPPPPAPPISSVPLPALPSPSLLYPSILHPLRSLPRMSRPVSCHVRESLTRLWAPAPPQGPSLPLAPRAAT